jgi:hypothetical protein
MSFDICVVRMKSLLLVLILLSVAALTGCSHGPKMYRVKGKVTYRDGTVPKGGVAVVRFSPSENSTAETRKGATGAIGQDGSFELMTRKPGDGVYPGDYIVTFVVLRNAMDQASSMILPKYATPFQSPYKETVKGNMEDLQYEIERLPGAAESASK